MIRVRVTEGKSGNQFIVDRIDDRADYELLICDNRQMLDDAIAALQAARDERSGTYVVCDAAKVTVDRSTAR